VTLKFNQAVNSASTYLPSFAGTTAQHSSTKPSSINRSLPDHILVVEILLSSSG